MLDGIEVDWLACDMVDCIAMFSTAGVGYAPAAVADDLERYYEMVDYLRQRPRTSEVSCFLELEEGLENTWKLLGERGVFAFDNRPRSLDYEILAIPATPITLRDLPTEIAQAIARIRFGTLKFVDRKRFTNAELASLI